MIASQSSQAPRGLPSRTQEKELTAGSLLGRRQRVEARRSKRIKGSPPPPKIARKRLVVSGPPALAGDTKEDEAEEVETDAPLGCQTTVNSGAMTCTDLAYLLSMDGFVGAIRLRDGLFLGDQLAATDQDFFNANVVLYVVNCCQAEIPNHFEDLTINNQKIQYLSFSWKDLEGEKIFSPRGTTLQRVYDFIEAADAVGASCLVHSKFGKSRSVCVVCAFLMMRYKWSAKKALEFLIARRPDLTLRRSFVRQILSIERYLTTLLECEMSTSWDVSEKGPPLSSEELLLRNTFKNSFAGSEGYSLAQPDKSSFLSHLPPGLKSKISWKGQDEVFESREEDPSSESPSDTPIKLPERSSFPSILKTRSAEPRRGAVTRSSSHHAGLEGHKPLNVSASKLRSPSVEAPKKPPVVGVRSSDTPKAPKLHYIASDTRGAPTTIEFIASPKTPPAAKGPKGIARKVRSKINGVASFKETTPPRGAWGSPRVAQAEKEIVSSATSRLNLLPKAPKSRSLSPATAKPPELSEPTVTVSFPRLLPPSEPTRPWRTTISEISQYPTVLDGHLIKPNAVVPIERRKPLAENPLFTLPRNPHRVASNTLEYRQPVTNVRLRELSDTRVSLPRSDFPPASNPFIGILRDPEMSRHSTMPPSPIAKVQVHRRIVPWDVSPPEAVQHYSDVPPRQETSHVSFSDGMAVTSQVTYLLNTDGVRP